MLDDPNTDVQLLLDDTSEACQSGKAGDLPLQSQHVIAVYKAIGASTMVTSFDNLHAKLKSLKRRPNETERQKYRDTLSQLHQLVEQKQKDVTRAIETYEKNFYQQNNMLPSKETDYIALYKELKYTRKVLRSWKNF